MASIWRSLVNARMIWMLTWMARLLFRTLDSMATPCSVNAKDKYLECWPLFKVTNCDLKDSCSSWLSRNIKSDGNLETFRLTACFRTLVSTP